MPLILEQLMLAEVKQKLAKEKINRFFSFLRNIFNRIIIYIVLGF